MKFWMAPNWCLGNKKAPRCICGSLIYFMVCLYVGVAPSIITQQTKRLWWTQLTTLGKSNLSGAIKTSLLGSASGISAALWFWYMDPDRNARKTTRWLLHQDAPNCTEYPFESVPNKWATVWKPSQNLWKDQKKADVCWALQEERGWNSLKVSPLVSQPWSEEARKTYDDVYCFTNKRHWTHSQLHARQRGVGVHLQLEQAEDRSP